MPWIGKAMRPVAAFLVALCWASLAGAATPFGWSGEWPRTDFGRTSVDLDEIVSGGPPKDGIPAIDAPVFEPVAEVDLPGNEPVIGLTVEGEARAYPLRILIWHEIVNDEIRDRPVAVTWCPLCNTGLVFDRRLGDRILDFGTTGKLRNSDLVMYDRQTESWWQQLTGEAIVGALAGAELAMLPARLESFAEFKARAPDGKVLVPTAPEARPYGRNPYASYERAKAPFLYGGPLPEGIAPLARVVRVGDEAWSLELVRRRGRIETGSLRLTWSPGQSSALDAPWIADGLDVGTVVVEERTPDGTWRDAVYSVDFAFAFHAFYPDRPIHTD
jgi:hypothetical protein